MANQGVRVVFESVLEQVLAIAAARPEVVAIVDHTALPSGSAAARAMGYGELVARAHGLAALLRTRGAGPERTVGVCLPRGAELAIAELGAWLAGAAFVPLDPDAPPARLVAIVRDAAIAWIVCGATTEATVAHAAAERVRIDRVAPADGAAPTIAPDQLAYVMYTSGSTGAPKGVAVEHGSLAHFVAWHRAAFALASDCRATLIYAPAFDSSLAELWPALTAGACLVVPDDDTRLDPARLQAWLIAERITHADLPAALVDRLLARPWTDDTALRVMLSGGDRLHGRPPAHVRWRLFNQYGPTETTVTATSALVTADGDGAPSIGRAMPGVTALVLADEWRGGSIGDQMQPVTEGELYLGGAGVARGYLGQPEATAARFVRDPATGARLYRTGDRVRRLASGELAFLGRVDDQLKLRGFRIEPAEIVAALRAHPAIAEAHVRLHDDALVAYVVPRDPRTVPDNHELRAALARSLPPAMIPARFSILERLPRTSRGKLDVAALPAPAVHRGRTGPAPTTEVERVLAEIWQAVLRVTEVGLDDEFFALGGHSLVAAQIAHQIADRLAARVSLRELFSHRTLRALAAVVEPRRGGAPITALVASGATEARASVQQEQVWFFEKLAPGSIAYRAQTTIRCTGPLDLARLERAVTEIVRRHELLRTTYEERNGQPWQVVQPASDVRVPVIDLGALAGAARDAARDAAVHSALRATMSMMDGDLLMRWTAIRLAPDEHELVLVEHHAVHDGESFAILIGELAAIYNALHAGGTPALPALPIQYADFARWQRAALAGPDMAADLAFWRARLAGAPTVLELPLDRPRPSVQSFHGDLVRFELPPALPGALRALSIAHGASPFAILLAAFCAVVHRYTGETDLCIGTAVANRGLRETERLIGMFVNAIVLRCDAGGDPTFAQLIDRASAVIAEASAHEGYPFPTLIEQLQLPRDPSRNPLIQTMFSFHDSVVTEPRLGDAACTVYEQGNGSSKLDLDVVVIPHAQRYLGDAERADDRMTVLWEYNRDLFDRATMERMAACWVRLAEAAVAAPERRLSELEMLSAAERRQATLPPVARAAPSVVAEVRAAAAAQPDAPAIVDDADDDRVVTYGELVGRAGGVAARLGAARLVGICLPRGAHLAIAELGAWLAGAAFVPLDPDAPVDRLRAIARDAELAAIVCDATTAAHSDAIGGLELIRVEQCAPAAVRAIPSPDSLAYVMYTSGSTGEPKGVAVEHASLASFVAWHRAAFELTARSRATLIYAPAFDSSLAELWPALAAGACLVMPDAEVRLVPQRLQAWLIAEHITHADLPAALVDRLLDLAWPDDVALRTLLSGGDRLHGRPPAGARWRLFNQYGPTEATVTATSGLVTATGDGSPSIGAPITGAAAYVLDDALRPVPVGVPGELYLAGAGVARGYWNAPEATAARFLRDPFAADGRMYRTGDRVRRLASGELAFLGRVDDQLKLRGFRIEPGEIIAVLRDHPAIADAHVVVHRDALVAYVIPRAAIDPAAVRGHVAARLPAYMVPSSFVALDAFPVTRHGKLDARALPPPEPLRSAPRQQPTTAREHALARTWQHVLGVDEVGIDDSFFELGGSSLLLAQVHHALAIPGLAMVALFEHPTIRQLARFLDRDDRARPAGEPPRPEGQRAMTPDRAIAVIGYACRLPGADDPAALWDLLAAGREAIACFDDRGAPAASIAVAADGEPIRAAGMIDGPERFDAALFGYARLEAAMIDPQQRVFLECAYAALDAAGCDPRRFAGEIGVYAGGSETPYLAHLRAHRARLAGATDWQLKLATGVDFLTSRAAYKLGLRGPAVTVQTGCSTSLVAIHLAAQALLAGDCDVALAGGATVNVPFELGTYTEGGVLAPDGHCRAFDASARGTVGADGAVVVVLKRWVDAVAARDHVHAVLLGSAINNDAAAKVGFTAPSVEGQARVIRAALAVAGAPRDTIGMIEAHGTGTALGDPIEVAALHRVFGGLPPGSCALGALKTNLGHTDAAAGAAGFLKAVLALEHRQLPPTLHFTTANPALALDTGPFTVDRALRDWPRGDAPRRAGVSSFGIGGTNAHAVLEEAPEAAPTTVDAGPQLLVVSAHTPGALERGAIAIAASMAGSLADVAWTLQTGRQQHGLRRFAVASCAADAAALTTAPTAICDGAPRVVFAFPGQGGQRAGMVRDLYARQRVFRAKLDEVAALAAPALGFDLSQALDGAHGARLAEMETAQVAVFAVEIALAAQWQAWGVTPAAVVGHSLGAYAAAQVAGVVSLDDALALVVARSRLLARIAPGAMIAVPLPEAEIAATWLRGSLELSAVNAPARCTVSGTTDDVAALHAALREAGVDARVLHIPRAGHSRALEPLLDELAAHVGRIALRPPRLPWISDLTGRPVTDAEATDPRYFVHHLRRPVRFADALAGLFDGPRAALLEVGPGRALTHLAGQHPAARGHVCIATLPHPTDPTSDHASALEAIGRLWAAGSEIAWPAVHDEQPRHRVPLPSYAFDRTLCAIEQATPLGAAPPVPAPAGSAAEWPAVAAIFGQVLGLTDVAPHAHFFELGGDSVMAAQLAAKLRAAFPGVAIKPRDVFLAPTVAALARLVERGAAS